MESRCDEITPLNRWGRRQKGHIKRMLIDPSPSDACPVAIDQPNLIPAKFCIPAGWWLLLAQLAVVIGLTIMLVI